MPRLTLPDTGRITIASAMRARTFMLAVGSGSSVWGDTPPDVAQSATALVAPVAMVRHSLIDFVTEAANGIIQASDGTRWSISATPSKYLYMAFVLGYADGPTEVLREFAIYSDPVLANTVPAGQTYIPWASVVSPGALFGMARFPPLERQGVHQTFGEIITF